MKKSIFTAAMLAVAFTFSGQIGAQGRHDECPHGVKPATKTPLEKTSTVATPKDAK